MTASNSLSSPEAWAATFSHWTAVAAESGLLAAPPLDVELAVIEEADATEFPAVWPRNPPRIELTVHFMAQAAAQFAAQHAAIEAALFAPPLTPGTVQQRTAALRCVADQVQSFVLLHELCHVLGGHLSAAMKGAGYVDESLYYLASSQSRELARRDYETAQRAYYLEIESDNTALQWQMQFRQTSCLTKFLSELQTEQQTEIVFEIQDGPARLAAFRAILIAQWLATRLIEHHRASTVEKMSSTHPLPASRLLAGISTVLEQYLEFADLEPDESGRKTLVLGEDDPRRIAGCLHDLLKPILTAPWIHHAQSDSLRAYTDEPATIATDLGNLLLMRASTSPPAHELDQVERLRKEMSRRLEPHRLLRRA